MDKTVLLIRNAAKEDFGGAETYQASLASILKDSGYTPIVVTKSQKLQDYARSNGVQVVKGWWWSKQNWSGSNALLFPLYLCWQLLLLGFYITLIIRLRASVLHIQSKDDFVAASVAGRLMRKRVVWTDHMDLRYIFQNLKVTFKNPVGKLVFMAAHFAHHIILISKNEYALVTAHFKDPHKLKSRIVIIKNGVIDKRSQLQVPDDTNVVSFCLASRIVRNKGVGEAIEAYIKMKDDVKKNEKTTLNIYGSGADLAYFKKMARKHRDIIFHGHQKDSVQKIYTNSVFMLPSYQEGFSIALLEATMLGMPIITTDVDSNGEIIQHKSNGLLVKPRDAYGLADAMNELLTDATLRKKLGERARKTYESKYNLREIITNQILPLYQ